ncbi:MAG: hypothetical protein J6B72_04140 [Clostridia bacterium]|nr:hypothetical protein [Clostridia bacterium]
MKKFNLKKVLSLVLCMLLLTSALLLTGCGTSRYDKGEEDDQGLVYYLTQDKSAYSVKVTGGNIATDVVIPSEFNGKPVTILDAASNLDSYVLGEKSLSIPDSITMLGCYGVRSPIDSYIDENGSLDGISSKLAKNVVAHNGSIYMGNESNPYLMLVYSCDEDYSTHSGTKLIADMAFDENVRSIDVSEEVVYIHTGAFRGIYCDTVRDEASGMSVYNGVKISVDENNQNYKTANNMLVNKDATKVIYCTLDLVTAVPETVKYFETDAISASNISAYREALISMEMASFDAPLYLPKGDNEHAVLLYAPEGSTISDKVEIIAPGAMVDFATVTIPESVVQIMKGAFSSFTLTSATVTTTGWYAADKYADGYGYDLGYVYAPDEKTTIFPKTGDNEKMAKYTKGWSDPAVAANAISGYDRGTSDWCRPVD